MIWFTLALFVVSFIITALLAPKPEFENARADQLDDAGFPRATENAPIPLVLGQVRLKGPNTLWYGDFESRPITQRVKVSLFKKKTIIVGHTYYLGFHMGLCLGPGVDLREIYIDDVSVWSGDTNGVNEVSISINKPDLFGGNKEGGGFVSSGTFYGGAFTQPVDSYIEGQVGAGNSPAYNGMSHIVFNKAYIGESAQLRKIAFVLESYTNGLGLPDNGTCNGGRDMNVAEAIFQIMTDKWRGLGVAVSDIDIVALQTVGATLHAEQNGCSVLVTSESDGARLITELLRQIDGIMYQDPESGKVTIMLIRDDYVIADLPMFGESSIVEVKNFTRTSWDEVQAQVKVSFPQREKESEAVAISQDMAVVATIGRLRTTTLSFPFVYEPDLANVIASRERAQRSVPLFRATIEVNRNANQLRPGQPFRFSWPDYGIVDLIMRVQRFDLGALTSGKIVIEALQDRFALSDVVFAAPAASSWVNVVYTPTNISVSRLVQMPRFFTNKLENEIPASLSGLLAVAARPGTSSTNYNVHIQEPAQSLDEAFSDPSGVIYAGSGLLTAAYQRSAGFSTGRDSVGFDLNSVVGPFVSVFASQIVNDYDNILLVDDEFMAYETAVDNGTGNWTISNVYRGLFGSRIEDHSIGARVYSIPADAFGDGFIPIIPDGGNFNVRLLDSAGGSTQSPEGIVETTYSVTTALNINDKPLRPGNIRLGGNRTFNPTVTAVASVSLTWAPRDHRVLPVVFEDGAAQTPAFSESYKIDVMVSAVRNATLSGTVGIGVTTYSIPFNLTAITNSDVEIRVTPVDTVNTKELSFSSYPINLQQANYPLVFTNGGADSGSMTGWVSTNMVVRSASPSPETGSHYFSGDITASGNAYQDVPVPVGAYTSVDAGTGSVQVNWFQNAFATGNDFGNVTLEFFDAAMSSLGTNAGPGNYAEINWNPRTTGLVSVPALTRFVRVRMIATRASGTVNNAYFDTFTGFIL